MATASAPICLIIIAGLLHQASKVASQGQLRIYLRPLVPFPLHPDTDASVVTHSVLRKSQLRNEANGSALAHFHFSWPTTLLH